MAEMMDELRAMHGGLRLATLYGIVCERWREDRIGKVYIFTLKHTDGLRICCKGCC